MIYTPEGYLAADPHGVSSRQYTIDSCAFKPEAVVVASCLHLNDSEFVGIEDKLAHLDFYDYRVVKTITRKVIFFRHESDATNLYLSLDWIGK